MTSAKEHCMDYFLRYRGRFLTPGNLIALTEGPDDEIVSAFDALTQNNPLFECKDVGGVKHARYIGPVE